jgi:hypothetical protein
MVGVGVSAIATNLSNGEARVQPAVNNKQISTVIIK